MKNTDQDLERMLAEMAEEAPPMPADFHERWMDAVRAESKNSSAAEKKQRNIQVISARWARILSVAAAFVFLIGGTLLYRSSKKSLSGITLKQESAVISAGEAPATTEPQEETWAEESVFTDAAENDEDLTAVYAVSAAGSNAQSAVFGGAYEAASEKAADSGLSETAQNVYEEAEEEPVPEEPAAEPLMTAMPTQTAETATEKPAEEAPTEEAYTEGSGFLRDAGAFLADMGGFLLAALPYLAVLAVPAAVALVFRRRKNK